MQLPVEINGELLHAQGLGWNFDPHQIEHRAWATGMTGLFAMWAFQQEGAFGLTPIIELVSMESFYDGWLEWNYSEYGEPIILYAVNWEAFHLRGEIEEVSEDAEDTEDE